MRGTFRAFRLPKRLAPSSTGGLDLMFDERIVESYLISLQIGKVVYEPDGKVPPDFLVDGRIAVEVRRLNQHYAVEGVSEGLSKTPTSSVRSRPACRISSCANSLTASKDFF